MLFLVSSSSFTSGECQNWLVWNVVNGYPQMASVGIGVVAVVLRFVTRTSAPTPFSLVNFTSTSALSTKEDASNEYRPVGDWFFHEKSRCRFTPSSPMVMPPNTQGWPSWIWKYRETPGSKS